MFPSSSALSLLSLALLSRAFVVPVQQQSTYSAPSNEDLDYFRLACLTVDRRCSSTFTNVLPENVTVNVDTSTLSHIQPSLLSTSQLVEVLANPVDSTLVPLASRFFPDIETDEDILVGLWVKNRFEEDASKVAADIQREVLRRANRRQQIQLVEMMGHGDGASLALLHAVHLARSLHPADLQINVYLFAPTRIGNGALTSYIESSPRLRIHTISSPSDPIPHLPSLAAGYRDPPSHVRLRVDPFGDLARDVKRPWGGLSRLGDRLRENLSAMRLESHLGPVLGEMFWNCDEMSETLPTPPSVTLETPLEDAAITEDDTSPQTSSAEAESEDSLQSLDSDDQAHGPEEELGLEEELGREDELSVEGLDEEETTEDSWY